MATIKINDLKVIHEVDNQDAATVIGGPAFMKLGDIKGECNNSALAPTDQLSLNYTKISF